MRSQEGALHRFRFFVVATFLTTGCSSNVDDKWSEMRPPVYRMKGKVIYRGEPASNAMVGFQTTGAGQQYGASGMTDPNGVFQLTTFQPGDGAVAGEHRVIIVKSNIEKASGGSPSYYDIESPDYMKGNPPGEKEVHLLPERYSRFGTSGLTATVNPDGKNEITFELVD